MSGSFDGVVRGQLCGWAIVDADPETSAALTIFIDGVEVGSVTADRYREDLRENDIRSGFASFIFNVPRRFFDGESHTVDIVEQSTGTSLHGCPQEVTFSVREMLFQDGESRAQQFVQRVVLFERGSFDTLVRKMQTTRRCAIFCSFHNNATFAAYHRRLFRAVRDQGIPVLLVHASDEPIALRDSLDDLGIDFLIVKKNIGYDFGSWFTGLHRLGEHVWELDELYFVNDSIFGPLFDLTPMLETMRRSNFDFWGIVDTYEHTYHLQSFFLCFGKAVCRSGYLFDLMNRYSFSSQKEVVIREGELRVTGSLIDEGFRGGTYCRYEEAAARWIRRLPQLVERLRALPDARMHQLLTPEGEPTPPLPQTYSDFLSALTRNIRIGVAVNPMHFFWDVLIEEMGCPFIKRELVFRNPTGNPSQALVLDTLAQFSDFNVDEVWDAVRMLGATSVPYRGEIDARSSRAPAPVALHRPGPTTGEVFDAAAEGGEVAEAEAAEAAMAEAPAAAAPATRRQKRRSRVAGRG